MSFAFGGTSVAQPATTSGFSFGATPAPATPSGFSFGAATPAQTPANSSSFSFGNSTGGSTAAQAPAASGFSFGNTNAAAAPPAAAASQNLFGASLGPTAAATQPTISGFNFGAAAAAPTTTTNSSSLFGGSNAATPTTTPSTTSGFNFGAPAQPTTSSFNFGTAPQQQQQQQQQASFGLFGTPAPVQQPQNGHGITLETPFEALPADVQHNIVAFHQTLKAADASDAFVKTVSPQPLDTLASNIARLSQVVLAHRNVQNKQATAVHSMRKDTKTLIHQVDAATLSLRTLDGSLTTSQIYSNLRHVASPSPFYYALVEQFEAAMASVKAQIESLERSAAAAAASSTSNLERLSPLRLQQILQTQHATLVHVAARVAAVHERADALRHQFLAAVQADRMRHGDASLLTNPFVKATRRNSTNDTREAIDTIRFRTSVAPTIVAPVAPVAAAPPSGFRGFSGFGTSATAPATTTPSVFGAPSPATQAPAPAGTSSFSFGTPTAAPKTVSFGFAGAAPTTTATTPATTTFAIPSVATTGSSAFGSVASTFMAPGGTGSDNNNDKRSASNKRMNPRAKKRA